MTVMNTLPRLNQSDLVPFGRRSIASNTRTALEGLYKTIYGEDSIRCLVTLGKGGLNVAHAIRHASKSHEVSEAAVHDLSKRQKTFDFCTAVKRWMESIHS
jgi:hypothetical protein